MERDAIAFPNTTCGQSARQLIGLHRQLLVGPLVATGDEQVSTFVKRFAEMGAPWTFGIDDLDALAGDAGLTVANDVKMAELFPTLRPNRQPESRFYDNYAVCTLAAPGG
jgi:hypothetical protein